MKPYFAKYLPVEGEIKENSWVIDKNGQIYKVNKYTAGHPLLSEIIIKNGLNLVKLFLCSRDIQVGDITHVSIYEGMLGKTDYKTVKIDNAPPHLPEGLMCYSEDGYYEYLKDCYKVIGEISPEATWVKEGDELDETEIKIIMAPSYKFHKTGQCPAGEVEGWTEWLPEKVKHIEIKGPCGHFH